MAEIVVVDDGSSDRTWSILQELSNVHTSVRPVQNCGPHGYGAAVVAYVWLEKYFSRGDYRKSPAIAAPIESKTDPAYRQHSH